MIPPHHWRVDVLTQYVEGSTLDAAGLSHLRVTHAPTGLSAESRLRSQHACIADARRQIEQRLAELQRLDLSDPRKALEELATVPAVAVRAREAVERLEQEVRDSYAREAKAAWDEHAHKPRAVEDQQSQQDRRQAAIDDAQDEARRLLAEVLL
jgi:protein subunit release factor B